MKDSMDMKSLPKLGATARASKGSWNLFGDRKVHPQKAKRWGEEQYGKKDWAELPKSDKNRFVKNKQTNIISGWKYAHPDNYNKVVARAKRIKSKSNYYIR